jgi:hypothetical protein
MSLSNVLTPHSFLYTLFMRDDKWLFQKLDEVWDKYFSDVPQDNDVHIVWGRKARTRLGSIKLGQKIGTHRETIITINGYFKDSAIPEFVILATIGHELAHYAHGFNSPLTQKYQTPHAGGVVHQEMRRRGLDAIERRQKKWLKENWRTYVQEKMPRKKLTKRKIIIKWI